MKIVINDEYGGFGLSLKAQKRYAELKGFELFFYKQLLPEETHTRIDNLDSADNLFAHAYTKDYGKKVEHLPIENFWSSYAIARNDSALIQAIEELGKDANTDFSSLKIVEIPDDVDWEINEHDGCEWVAEEHRRWG